MNTVLWWLGQNALATAILIPLVALVCRLFRDRPAVQHLLWLVVLAKFLTPPVVVWPWTLPTSLNELFAATPNVTTLDLDAANVNVTLTQMPAAALTMPAPEFHLVTRSAPVVEERSLTWLDVLPVTILAVWIAGGLAFAFVQLRRISRFAAIVRQGSDAPTALANAIADVAGEMRVRPPRTIVSNGIGSPFVWCLGWLRLVWPSAMAGAASLANSRGVIAHELAHVKRRDHWTSWLVLIAGLAWWWNPLFWFVRRHLRETSEMACDALAIHTCPERRREYAELLLELSAGFNVRPPVAVLGVSAGGPASFERRLHMILSDRVTSKTSLGGLFAALAVAALALPGWSMDPVTFTVAAPPPAAVQKLDEAIKQLEKADPKNAEEAKKQIGDIRKQLEEIRNGLQAGPAFNFAVGGAQFAPAAPVAPAWAPGGVVNLVAVGGPMANNRFGAMMHRPDPLVVAQLRLPADQGQVVSHVQPDSPAAKAGLKQHDILLALANKPVSSDMAAFNKDVAEIKVDAEVTATVLRDGKKEVIKGLKLPEANIAIQAFPINGIPIQMVPGAPGIQIFPGGPIPPMPPVPPLPGAGPINVPLPAQPVQGQAIRAIPAGNVIQVQPAQVQPLPPGFGGPIQIQGQAIRALPANPNGANETTNDFAIHHVSGNAKIEIRGKRVDGKATPTDISIDDGPLSLRTQSLQQVPADYLPTINRLLESVK